MKLYKNLRNLKKLNIIVQIYYNKHLNINNKNKHLEDNKNMKIED